MDIINEIIFDGISLYSVLFVGTMIILFVLGLAIHWSYPQYYPAMRMLRFE